MSGYVQDDVEDVVSAEQDVAVVGEHLFFFVFCGAFQQDVHVSVDFDHFAFVFAAVFEDDFDVAVELFYENVEWLFAWLHARCSAVFKCTGMHTAETCDGV